MLYLRAIGEKGGVDKGVFVYLLYDGVSGGGGSNDKISKEI
jgi:hypothetical protein